MRMISFITENTWARYRNFLILQNFPVPLHFMASTRVFLIRGFCAIHQKILFWQCKSSYMRNVFVFHIAAFIMLPYVYYSLPQFSAIQQYNFPVLFRSFCRCCFWCFCSFSFFCWCYSCLCIFCCRCLSCFSFLCHISLRC